MSDELLKLADVWASEDPAYIPGSIIKRLAARVRELEAERDAYRDAATARDRNEDALRRDAERWRYLRNTEDDSYIIAVTGEMYDVGASGVGQEFQWIGGEEADNLIDAAIDHARDK